MELRARLSCPLSPGVCSDSCMLNQWCCLTFSSSATPFSFCLQSFPSMRVFSSESALHIRWPKDWSFSFSISSYNEYSGLISFRIDWSISLLSNGLSRIFSSTTIQKHQFFGILYGSALTLHVTPGKAVALTIQTFVGKVICLLLMCCLGLSKEQTSFNFMVAVIICSDFWSPRK